MKSSSGYKYILVITDYVTRYPEAIPLRITTATKIAEELLKCVSRMGVLHEIITNQGTNFMSGVMKAMCLILDIKKLRTSIYQPQTNGLVEQLNGIIKWRLHCCAQKEPQKWGLLLTPLLFALSDTPQALTRFSPFELVFSNRPRELLQVV